MCQRSELSRINTLPNLSKRRSGSPMAPRRREVSISNSIASSTDPLDCIDDHSFRAESCPPSPKSNIDNMASPPSPGKRKVSDVETEDEERVTPKRTKKRRIDSESEGTEKDVSEVFPSRRPSSSGKGRKRVIDSEDEDPEETPRAERSAIVTHQSSDLPPDIHSPQPHSHNPTTAIELPDTHIPPEPLNFDVSATLPPISAAGVLPVDLNTGIKDAHPMIPPFDNLVPPGPSRSASPITPVSDLPTEEVNDNLSGEETKQNEENAVQDETAKISLPKPPPTSTGAVSKDTLSDDLPIEQQAEQEEFIPSTENNTPTADQTSPAAIQSHVTRVNSDPEPDVAIEKEDVAKYGETTEEEQAKAEDTSAEQLSKDENSTAAPVEDHAVTDLPPSPTKLNETLPSTAASEGEEELNDDDANIPMDVDEPARSPTTAEVAVDTPTSASRAPSPVKQRGKPGPKPKPKEPKDKDGKPKQSSSTAKPKKATKSKAKTKIDDLKSSTSKARSPSVSSVQPSASVASSDVRAHREDTIESDDNAVYCICKKPYNEEDEDVVMVACDGCDNWFHPECIGMTEAKLDLLDSYICAQCESTTAQRTSYKLLCRRDRCGNSVAGRSSKYCSSTCAFQHMAEQIPPTTNKKLLKQISSTFIGLPKPKLGIITLKHNTAKQLAPTSRSDAISALQAQIDAVDAALDLVRKRQQILSQAMTRCEVLAPVVIPTHSTTSKKGKPARSGGEDKPCGWDFRLLWDDEEMTSWDGSDLVELEDGGLEGVCMAAKRRCDRHQGWQKTIGASLEFESGQLERRHDLLEAQKAQTLDLRETAEASVKARELFLQRLEATSAIKA